MDPLTKQYPWYTPYQFAGNKPINSIDLDGLEELEQYKMSMMKRQAMLQVPVAPRQQEYNQPVFTQGYARGSYEDQRSREMVGQYQYNKDMAGATMDPLAAGMVYPIANSVGQFSKGVVEHAHGIYQGIKEENYWKAAKNTGLLALDIAPFMPFKGAGAAGSAVTSADEIFSMSIATRGFAEDFALTTKAYQGFQNANKVIQPNNPVFDLFDRSMNVVDVTTTNAKTLNAGQFYTKLNKLAGLDANYGNRTLQIYVREGQYTSEQLNSLSQKLKTFIGESKNAGEVGFDKTNFNITQIK